MIVVSRRSHIVLCGRWFALETSHIKSSKQKPFKTSSLQLLGRPESAAQSHVDRAVSLYFVIVNGLCWGELQHQQGSPNISSSFSLASCLSRNLDGRNRAIVVAKLLARAIAATSIRWWSYLA